MLQEASTEGLILYSVYIRLTAQQLTTLTMAHFGSWGLVALTLRGPRHVHIPCLLDNPALSTWFTAYRGVNPA